MKVLSEENIKIIGRTCGWAAGALLLFSVLTGYGITEYNIVTSLTFGILGKATSQRIHNFTDIPLIVFLAVHVGTALWGRLARRN
jgi:hypothetical protein